VTWPLQRAVTPTSTSLGKSNGEAASIDAGRIIVSAKKSRKLLDSLVIDPDLEKLLPPTTAQEDKAHKKTIQKEGVLYPLVADEQGVLIDGIRTYKVCRELSIRDVWVVTLYGLNEEERRHKRLALNVNGPSPDQEAETRTSASGVATQSGNLSRSSSRHHRM
jgi:hypothetical protein